MQFSCESCKATLHIGDEKVKGKRLVVRCKKCGARIQIADPALGPPPAGAAPLAASSPPAAKPAPAPAPKAARPAEEPKPRTGDSDTESTQAMDSGVLEQALRASKADDATIGDGLPQLSGATLSRPPPPPADIPEPPAPPRDPPIWFAMVAGKQTGPLSRAELGLKVGQGQVNPRTYLWKEGMAGWQRAQEVTELANLFGAAKPAAAPLGNTAPPPVPASARITSSGRSRETQAPLGEPVLELSGGGDTAPPLAIVGEERRGRQRQEPQFAKESPLDDSNISSSGPSLALELDGPINLGRQNQALKSSSALPKPGNNVTITPSNLKSLSASLFPPEREMSRDPLSPAPQADEDDRTHVEPLPLGERVHQEAVHNELFSTSSENSPVSSAKDLAGWASKEMGRRLPTEPKLGKLPPVSSSALPRVSAASPLPDSVAPTLGGAALGPDPFDVPDAPSVSKPNPVETTGNIIARSGVQKKRTGTLLLLFAAVLVLVAVLVYSLAGSNNAPAPAPAGNEAQQQALGGTGESVTGLVQGKTSGTVAAPMPEPVKAPSKRIAAAPPPAPAKPDDGHAAQDAQALANLDNERGIGNHGPKADAVPTPDTAKSETSLSADDIKKKLGENKGALQSCIDEALHKEPNLRVGKIHIATTIASSGVVTAAKIDKPTVDGSPLGACLKRATKRIVFPAFSGDAFEVDIPILVTAGD